MTGTLYGSTEEGFKLATAATLSPFRLTWYCVRYGASKPNANSYTNSTILLIFRA